MWERVVRVQPRATTDDPTRACVLRAPTHAPVDRHLL
eukprot:COSAG01_NODE_32901_length_573_cov_1.308017_1_plen_36_part_10